MQVRSSKAVREIRSTTAAVDLLAASRNGNAMPAMSAPSASAFAASTPERMPPLPMTWTPGTAANWRIDSGVGSPQSAKRSPSATSSARAASIRAQLVPPTPAVSRIRTPTLASSRPTAAEMPQPISLTTTGTSSASTTRAIFGSRPRKFSCPSGCSASCRALRCSTRASASTMSTATRHSSMP